MSQIKGPLVSPQDLFTSVAPNSNPSGGTDIGNFATTADGRGFRYTLAGAAALVPGKLYQASAEDTSNLQNLAVVAAGTAAIQVVTSSSVTVGANALAGGLMVVTTSVGAGYTYKIKSNPVASAGALTINLEDPLLTNLTTASRIDLIPNPYAGVIVNPAAASSAPVGVAIYPVNAGSYGWIQTHGPVAVLADGALVVGQPVAASAGTAGAVEAFTGTSGTTFVVGVAVTGVATTEYGVVSLTID